MNHLLTAFTAPETSIAQATVTSPPAHETPAPRAVGQRITRLKFMAGVVANAAGFGLLLAGCWFSLQCLDLLMAV